MRRIRIVIFTTALVLIAGFAVTFAVRALAQPAASLDLISPAACPSSGCAAGQRINLQAGFDVSPVFNSGSNLQVCLYSSTLGNTSGSTPWIDPASLIISGVGSSSGLTYTGGDMAGVCSSNLPGFNYVLIGSSHAIFTTSSNDLLPFAFRINRAANISGSVVMRAFQPGAGGANWTMTSEAIRTFSVSSTSSTGYVANDASTCGVQSPCYINSGDDLFGGVGTGLKDAIDALPPPALIKIIRNYLIKGNTVVLDQPHQVQGDTYAGLSYSGSTCTAPMILMVNGGSLSKLNINAGNCISLSRDLVHINSPANVLIESNTMINGLNAISIFGNTGNLTLRFNHIQNNSGYAIFQDGLGTTTLTAVANNLYGNRIGSQVECNTQGNVDHNFWGPGITPSTGSSHCVSTNGLQLGAAIQTNPPTPGVDARIVTVTAIKATYFNGAISFQHQVGESDYNLYVINQGNGSDSNIPFLGHGTDTLAACSNFWDIFLDPTANPNSLNIYTKYDLSQNCIDIINSSLYCGQTINQAKYPLWWYDPRYVVTAGWDTTGQNPQGSGAQGAMGQITGCLIDSHEIMVAVGTTGRPNLSTDMSNFPLVAGLPAAINLTNFTVTSGIAQSLIQWQTSSETKVSGFYITRSTAEAGPYGRTSDLINAKGGSQIGGIYNFQDINLSYGTNYYYKIEVIGSDGSTVAFYGPVAGMTATATPTITPTHTVTMTPTITQTFTGTPTRTARPIAPTSTPWYYYHSPTPYSYPIATRTRVGVRSSTPTPNTFSTLIKSATATLSRPTSGTGIPGYGAATQTGNPGYNVPTVETLNGIPGYEQPNLLSPNPTLETGHPQLTPSPTASIDQGGPTLTLTFDKTKQGSGSRVNPPSNQLGDNPVKHPIFWVSLAVGGVLALSALSLAGWYIFQQRMLRK